MCRLSTRFARRTRGGTAGDCSRIPIAIVRLIRVCCGPIVVEPAQSTRIARVYGQRGKLPEMSGRATEGSAGGDSGAS